MAALCDSFRNRATRSLTRLTFHSQECRLGLQNIRGARNEALCHEGRKVVCPNSRGTLRYLGLAIVKCESRPTPPRRDHRGMHGQLLKGSIQLQAEINLETLGRSTIRDGAVHGESAKRACSHRDMFANAKEASCRQWHWRFLFLLTGIQQAWRKQSLESRAKRPSAQPVARRGDGTVEYSKPQLERLSRNPWEFENKLREHDIDLTKATNRRFVELTLTPFVVPVD